MSLKGRGRSRGRPRGRGLARTTIWEWETYKPGPEVYNQLWHLRKAPPTISRHLSSDCPIPNAQSRILGRNQTDDGFNRNYYTVQITYTSARGEVWTSEVENAQGREERTVVEEVDMSRILGYVSHRELERFENAEFIAEAEAEAAAQRAEMEELERRRLEKNARVSGTGRGRRMLSELGFGLDPAIRAPTRGRPRGRSGGRGRGTWRGREALMASGLPATTGNRMGEVVGAEGLVDAVPLESLNPEDQDLQQIPAETEDEDEEWEDEIHVVKQMSPDLARSSFVASSALPVSPAQRKLSAIPIMRHRQPEIVEPDGSDIEEDSNSSVVAQLRHGSRGRALLESDEASVEDDRHRAKRRRTESTSSHHHRPTSCTLASPSMQHHHELTRPTFERHPLSLPSESDTSSDTEEPTIHAHPIRSPKPMDVEHPFSYSNDHDETHNSADENDNDDDLEEYIVGAILDHSYDAGTKYYLVKWEGYDDGSDWVPESELGGALELIGEYDERIMRGA